MMKTKADASPSFVKMEQARRLLHQGHYQESLVLALDALLQELDILRNAVLALQTTSRAPLPAPEESSQPEIYWLPPVKPRILH